MDRPAQLQRVYPNAEIQRALSALDRAWVNANVSEAARKDIQEAMTVLQAGTLIMDGEEVSRHGTH